jgi:hypothetical protein
MSLVSFELVLWCNVVAGLRHSPVAVGINGLMSVLIYLIAAQVWKRKHMGSLHGRAVVSKMHQLVV